MNGKYKEPNGLQYERQVLLRRTSHHLLTLEHNKSLGMAEGMQGTDELGNKGKVADMDVVCGGDDHELQQVIGKLPR